MLLNKQAILQHVKYISASGPLHWLFLFPGRLCSVPVSPWLVLSSYLDFISNTSFPARQCGLSHHVITQFYWQERRDLHSLEHILLPSIPLCLFLLSGEISQSTANFTWTKNTWTFCMSLISSQLAGNTFPSWNSHLSNNFQDNSQLIKMSHNIFCRIYSYLTDFAARLRHFLVTHWEKHSALGWV